MLTDKRLMPISLLRARKCQATKQTHVGVWKELNFSSALLIISERREHRLCMWTHVHKEASSHLSSHASPKWTILYELSVFENECLEFLNKLKCIVQWHSFCLSPFLALHTIQWKCLNLLICLSSCHSLMSAFYSLENFHSRVFIFEFFLVM